MQVVLLVPSRTETRWSQLAMMNATSILFFRARLQFGKFGALGTRKGASAPFPSALYGFGVSLRPLADIGIVIEGGGRFDMTTTIGREPHLKDGSR